MAQITPYEAVRTEETAEAPLRNERALQRRLDAERVIAHISAEFLNLGPDQTDAGIEHALAAIGQFTQADRSFVFSYSDDGLRVTNTHEWCAEGVRSQRERIQNQPTSLVPWFMKRIRQQRTVAVPSVSDLPEDAAADRAEWKAQGIVSLLGVAMTDQGSLLGVLGLDAVTSPRLWDKEDEQFLHIVAGIIVNALQHKRAQAIAAGQRRLLELLATGGSSTDTLHALVRVIEEQLPGIQGLVLLLDPDGLHLHIGAAVSLPEEYTRSIEGLEIGPMVGSCGTACYRRERVIVEDISTDPRWEALRALALRHGLRACWSEPVFDANGRVVGTFALYYREPRGPSYVELQTIQTAAHLVGIAVAHEDAQKEIAQAYQSLERREQERTHALATLNAIANTVSRSLDLDAILSDALDKTLEVMGMELGLACRLATREEGGADAGDRTRLIPLAQRGIWDALADSVNSRPLSLPHLTLLLGSEPLVGEVASQRPSLYREALLRQGVRLFISVPLISKGKLLGAMILGSDRVRTVTADELSLLQAVGNQVAVAIENAQLYQDALRRQAEAERARLARELHDSVTQSIYSVTLYAEAAARLLVSGQHAKAAEYLRELRDTSQEALREMRLLVFELRPPGLEQVGLAGALEARLKAVEARGGMTTEFTVEGDGPGPWLSLVDQRELFTIAQEALNNAFKHARCARIAVHLQYAEQAVRLVVRDNGAGFDVAAARTCGGMGLAGMAERATRIGGTLAIQSSAGAGTTVTVEVARHRQGFAVNGSGTGGGGAT